jgi:hypothetical protein
MHVKYVRKKSIDVTIEDIEMENCLRKAKFTLQKGVQAYGDSKHEEQTIGLIFISDTVGPCPLHLDWSGLGAQSACNWLTLHLEYGNGVGSNFGTKTELSEQEPGTISS